MAEAVEDIVQQIEVHIAGQQMSETVAAEQMAVDENFSDAELEELKGAFSLKYLRHCWSDSELETLFKTKLAEKAKAQYEALPREVRRCTFGEVMRAMSEAYKDEEDSSLERLSADAYPELDNVALATTRAQQLYEQMVHWPESYHLLVAMEATGADAYANLKETAMRIERRKLTLENAKESVALKEAEMRQRANKGDRNRGAEFSRDNRV
ncbi:hypothetical protein OSTOST_01449 [Ostertagia ostertagi]